MYHSVASTSSPEQRELTVAPERFDEQIGALIASGVRIVPLADVLAMLRGDGGDDVPVAAVTIDDAFADVVDAAQILARHQARATVFVPTAFVGARAAWLRGDDSRRPLASWSALADLRDAGIEIGGHSHLHIAADTNPPAIVEEDARRCRFELEEQLGVAATSFAYPFGFQTPGSRRAVAKAGFTLGCTTNHLRAASGDDPLALPRLLIGPSVTGEQLTRMVTVPRSRWIEDGLRGKAWLLGRGRQFIGFGPVNSRRITPLALEEYGSALFQYDPDGDA